MDLASVQLHPCARINHRCGRDSHASLDKVAFDALAGAHHLVVRRCWSKCRVEGWCDKADVVEQRDGFIDQGLQGFQTQEIDVAHQHAIPVTLTQPATYPIWLARRKCGNELGFVPVALPLQNFP